MKKLIPILFSMLLLTFLIAMNGCKKDTEDPVISEDLVEVSFDVSNVTPGDLKSGGDSVLCQDLLATHVVITYHGPAPDITPKSITLDVYYLGNIPYTKAIKLAPGTYTIDEFIVYSGTQVIEGTPHAGSGYAAFLSDGMSLSRTFTVQAWKKLQLKVEVVCYKPEVHAEFGFIYFKLDEIIVREQWFFGDICIKDVADYNIPGTTDFPNYYTIQNGGPITTYDLPAIFRVEVWRNGVHQLPDYTNAGSLVSGPVKVQYGDYKNQVDNFEFKLFVYARVGAGFGWYYLKSWTFNDISDIQTQAPGETANDNVVDFVVGTCIQSASNYQFAPILTLPLTCTLYINECWCYCGTSTPQQPAYVGFDLQAFPAGVYDLLMGENYGFCADVYNLITVQTLYNMNVYSSLFTAAIPSAYPAKNFKWDQMNWIVNNYNITWTNWKAIQAAFWILNNGWTDQDECGVSVLGDGTWAAGNVIASAALAAVPLGNQYLPPPGGWACVIFCNQANNTTQTLFTKVDP